VVAGCDGRDGVVGHKENERKLKKERKKKFWYPIRLTENTKYRNFTVMNLITKGASGIPTVVSKMYSIYLLEII
jgi:hypothetical protein